MLCSVVLCGFVFVFVFVFVSCRVMSCLCCVVLCCVVFVLYRVVLCCVGLMISVSCLTSVFVFSQTVHTHCIHGNRRPVHMQVFLGSLAVC